MALDEKLLPTLQKEYEVQQVSANELAGRRRRDLRQMLNEAESLAREVIDETNVDLGLNYFASLNLAQILTSQSDRNEDPMGKQELLEQAMEHVEKALRLIERPRPSAFGAEVNPSKFSEKYGDMARELKRLLTVRRGQQEQG